MNIAVIGSFWGDCGKGLSTDFFSSKIGEDGYVVRYNGTAQSGHSVVTDNRSHVFHHIGSGTFNGTPTFLSKFFVVHPMLFRDEYETLKDLNPIVYVDDRCLVITPYDMLINQAREKSRTERHGSVGLGFSECISRSLTFSRLTVYDLFFTKTILLKHIERIRDKYTIPILEELNATEELQYAMNENILHNFMDDIMFFIDNVKCVSRYKGIDIRKNFIFEGAQGLMLDEDFGYFPNVTRSRTGTKNILTLSKELGVKIDDIYRITRSYLTRHGSGHLPFECQKEEVSEKINETTNTFNEYQEHLRFSPFNFQLLEYVLKQDDAKGINSNIILTCMDQMNELIPIIDVQGNKKEYFSGQFLEIMKRYGTKYVSYGPTRKDIMEI